MRLARTAPAVLVLAASLSSGGCFYGRSDGERLARESAAQAERLAALETSVTTLTTQATEQHAALDTQLTELRARIDEVRQQLEASGRGSADLGADLAMVRDITQRLDGRLAEIDQSIAATQAQVREQDAQLDQQIRLLAQRTGVDISLREADIPADRTEHFAAAYRAYQQPDLIRARALFGAYIQRYPNDDQSDNAQYWIAKSYQDQQQWQRAVGQYREFIRLYQSTSDVLDQALFAMSQAFYELHDCVNARTALEALKQSRPQSPLIRDVDRRLRELRSPPRGYCAG